MALLNDQKERTCLISSREQMLTALVESKAGGNVLGIWSRSLGRGMYLCTVKEVLRDEDENDYLIILNEDTMVPLRLNEYVVYLRELDGVYTFSS